MRKNQMESLALKSVIIVKYLQEGMKNRFELAEESVNLEIYEDAV